MNIVSTRFGIVPTSEAELVQIPEGLVGFRGHTRFVLMPDSEAPSLTWLQSVSAPELAFALISPPQTVGDYKIELRPGDRAALELDDERSAVIYVILNRSEAGGLTANLQGPLVFNLARRLGRQIVLTSSRYAVRYPLGQDSSSSSSGSSSSHSRLEFSSSSAKAHQDYVAEPALLVGAAS